MIPYLAVLGQKVTLAYVEHTPHFELAPNEVNDYGTVCIRNPAPNTVQTDVVEIRQVSATAELGKRLIEQLDTGARYKCQLLGKSGLGRIEVCAKPFRQRSRCVDIGTHPLAESKLTSRTHFRKGNPGMQES